MKFLIKIEEAINHLIERLFNKIKGVTPDFVFACINWFTHLPSLIKRKIKEYAPKVRLFFLKFIGYSDHYFTLIRGTLISFFMYFRSEEFKKADKTALVLKPFRYAKKNPLNAFAAVMAFVILSGATSMIFFNAQKIAVGTLALRKPASMSSPEEDIYFEIKNHKFEVKVALTAGHKEETPEAVRKHDLYLDIKIEANNPEDKEYLESMEEMLLYNISSIDLPVTQLPLAAENQKMIEEFLARSLNDNFRKIGRDRPIKNIKLNQILSRRPVYYRQHERLLSVVDMNLQIFLEDTHRNRQVWIDFTVLTSNRNIVQYLTNHEVEFKDHLTTNVEPVIPQLPVEDEGRRIIKDKIKAELNLFLEKNNIEGKILEVYLDYLMST